MFPNITQEDLFKMRQSIRHLLEVEEALGKQIPQNAEDMFHGLKMPSETKKEANLRRSSLITLPCTRNAQRISGIAAIVDTFLRNIEQTISSSTCETSNQGEG